MHHADGMSESRLVGPRKHEIAHSKLLDAPKALELSGIDQFQQQRSRAVSSMARCHAPIRITLAMSAHLTNAVALSMAHSQQVAYIYSSDLFARDDVRHFAGPSIFKFTHLAPLLAPATRKSYFSLVTPKSGSRGMAPQIVDAVRVSVPKLDDRKMKSRLVERVQEFVAGHGTRGGAGGAALASMNRACRYRGRGFRCRSRAFPLASVGSKPRFRSTSMTFAEPSRHRLRVPCEAAAGLDHPHRRQQAAGTTCRPPKATGGTA